MKDAACSFCGRRRDAVGVLVAAEDAAICETCAITAIAAVEEHASADSWLRASVGVLLGSAAALLARGYGADTRRVIDATVAVASGRRDLLMTIAARCAALYLLEAARRALLLVPQGDRNDAWRLAACSVDYDAGDHRRADAWLDEIDAGRSTPEDWAVQRLFRIACRLRTAPAPSRTEAQEHLRTITDLQLILPGAHTATAFKRRAECLLHVGDPREAARLLRQLEAAGTLDIDGAFIAAEAAWMMGDDAAAMETWSRVARGSPELEVVRRAQRRVQAPPDRQGPYR